MDTPNVFVSGSRLSRRPRKMLIRTCESLGLTAVTYEDCPSIVDNSSLTEYLNQHIDLVLFLACESISDTQHKEITSIENEFLAERGPALYLIVPRQLDASQDFWISQYRDAMTGRYFIYKDNEALGETVESVLLAFQKKRPAGVRLPDGSVLALKDNKAAQALLGILSDKTQEEAVAAYETTLDLMPGTSGNFNRHKACLEKMKAGNLSAAREELLAAHLSMKNFERLMALVGAMVCSHFSGDAAGTEKYRQEIRDSKLVFSTVKKSEGTVFKVLSAAAGFLIGVATHNVGPMTVTLGKQGKEMEDSHKQELWELTNLFQAIQAVCLNLT